LKIALVLVALLLQATLWISPAAAQARVSITVDAGYDGYYSTQSPTPIRMRLANEGESFRARVELTAPAQNGSILYYAELDLPQNSEKLLTLYPHYAGFVANAQVRVLDNQQLVTRGEDKLTQVDGSARLFGLLAPDTAPYAALPSRQGGAESAIARLKAETLPERADALVALDTLVVDGVDTSALSKAQQAALDGWVQLGGTLIVAGGPDATRNATGLGDLMPVALGSQRNASDLGALTSLAGSPPPRGGVITRATPGKDTRIAVNSPDGPLVVNRALGQGSITWLAWSPSAPPFREWPGNAKLLRGIAEQTPVAAAQGTPVDGWVIDSFLRNIAGAKLPPTLLVAGFLVLYSLVVGPVLYLILKRRDRRELAWVLVPAITLAFSGMAYGANFLIRGTGTTLRTLEIVETYGQSGAQRVTTHAGLFSTSRRDYDIALAPGYTVGGPNREGIEMNVDQNGNQVAPSGGPVYTVEVGEESVLRDVSVDVYSLRTFAAQRVENGGAATIEATLSGNGTVVAGSVRNTSAAPLDQVYVMSQDGLESIGAIQPGQSAKVTGNPERNFNNFEGDRSEKDWDKRQIAQNLYDRVTQGGPDGTQPLPANEVLVLAWQKATDQSVRVLDAKTEHSAERLVILHSRYTLQSGSIDIQLKPEQVTSLSSEQGVSVLTYRLPPGTTAESLRIVLDARVIGGAFTGEGMVGPAVVAPDLGVAVATVQRAPVEEVAPMGPSGMGNQVSELEIVKANGEARQNIYGQFDVQEVSMRVTKPAPYIAADGTVTVRVRTPAGDDPMFLNALRLKVVGRKR